MASPAPRPSCTHKLNNVLKLAWFPASPELMPAVATGQPQDTSALLLAPDRALTIGERSPREARRWRSTGPAVPDHHETPERGFRLTAFNLCRSPTAICAGDKARASAAFVFILSDL
jgi:hypothetical protein